MTCDARPVPDSSSGGDAHTPRKLVACDAEAVPDCSSGGVAHTPHELAACDAEAVPDSSSGDVAHTPHKFVTRDAEAVPDSSSSASGGDAHTPHLAISSFTISDGAEPVVTAHLSVRIFVILANRDGVSVSESCRDAATQSMER